MKQALPTLAAAALLLSALAGAPARAQDAAAPAASAPLAAAPAATTGKDPLEGLNRKVFAFNDALDRTVLKPVATVYRDTVPSPVRTAVGNFIGNFADVWSAFNQFLQGKPQQGVEMTMRVAVNTVFGVLGLVDFATEMGLERQSEDLGQTLGRWGLGAGPYLVLPVLGPSSLRDTAALPLDLKSRPSAWIDETARSWQASAVQGVHRRSELLGASDVLDDVALDKYSFLRDAYLARRRNQVYDGNPPEDADVPDDEAEDAPAAMPADAPGPVPAPKAP